MFTEKVTSNITKAYLSFLMVLPKKDLVKNILRIGALQVKHAHKNNKYNDKPKSSLIVIKQIFSKLNVFPVLPCPTSLFCHFCSNSSLSVTIKY